jgi:hypothetical protein
MPNNYLYYQLRRVRAQRNLLRSKLDDIEQEKDKISEEHMETIKSHIYYNTVLHVGCYFSGIIFMLLFNKITNKC